MKTGASRTAPLRAQAIVPQGAGRNTGNSSKVKNSTAQRNSSTNEKLKLSGKTAFPNNAPLVSPHSMTKFYQLKLSPPRRNHVMGGCFVQHEEEKTAVDSFMVFTGSYFMGISYSVVQVIFKAGSHPLIPPKLPSPNNRLKAIQLSPLYSVHFIFSLPCTSSLTTPAIGSGGWRRNTAAGWVGDFCFLGREGRVP